MARESVCSGMAYGRAERRRITALRARYGSDAGPAAWSASCPGAPASASSINSNRRAASSVKFVRDVWDDGAACRVFHLSRTYDSGAKRSHRVILSPSTSNIMTEVVVQLSSLRHHSTARATRFAVIFSGCRSPNGEVPASAWADTTILPEHSFSQPALHAASWLSSAQFGGHHQGIFVPCSTCSTIGTTPEDLPSRSTLSFSNTTRAEMH